MKLIATALATAALLSVGATAAFAADHDMSMSSVSHPSGSIGNCDALQGPPEDWSTTPLADKLNTEGVKYNAISTFGSCFEVSMTSKSGEHEIQLYDPSTLTRVL